MTALTGRVIAQSVTVDATIDSLQILIGEQAKIKLQVSLDTDKRAILPAYTDTLVRGVEIVDLINKNTNCKATMNDLADKDLLKEKMHAADLFCDATGVGMHPLEDLSNIPDPSFFKKDLIVTDTVYAPRETVMMKQAKEAGCEKVFNGMGMMLFQALIAIKLYTGKDTPVDYMKEKLGI